MTTNSKRLFEAQPRSNRRSPRRSRTSIGTPNRSGVILVPAPNLGLGLCFHCEIAHVFTVVLLSVLNLGIRCAPFERWSSIDWVVWPGLLTKRSTVGGSGTTPRQSAVFNLGIISRLVSTRAQYDTPRTLVLVRMPDQKAPMNRL